jgi:hypothetical protein
LTDPLHKEDTVAGTSDIFIRDLQTDTAYTTNTTEHQTEYMTPTSNSDIETDASPAVNAAAEWPLRPLVEASSKENGEATTAPSAMEGDMPSQVLIQVEPDEAEAIRLLICAETVPVSPIYQFLFSQTHTIF